MMMTEFNSDKDGYISYTKWEVLSKEGVETTKKEADIKGISIEQYIKTALMRLTPIGMKKLAENR